MRPAGLDETPVNEDEFAIHAGGDLAVVSHDNQRGTLVPSRDEEVVN